MSQTTIADLLLGAREKKREWDSRKFLGGSNDKQGENWDQEIKSVPHEQLGSYQKPTFIQMHSKQTWIILLMKAIQLLKS